MYVQQVKNYKHSIIYRGQKSFTGLNLCSFCGFYKATTPWSHNQSKPWGCVSDISHCHGNGQGYISDISHYHSN